MAAKNGSKGLAVVKSRATPSRVDAAADQLDENLPVARAIADALKVLTALERVSAQAERPGTSTGEGYADGYAVVDATMPELASHLRGLIEQIEEDASCIREEYDALTALYVSSVSAEASNG